MGGAVTVNADTTFKASIVTFGSTVDASASASSVTVAGDAVLAGQVGVGASPANFAVSGSTRITAGGVVRASGLESFGGTITLGADATLVGKTLRFASGADLGSHVLTLNGAATFAPGSTLTVAATGVRTAGGDHRELDVGMSGSGTGRAGQRARR